MDYSFNTDVAKEVGLNAASIYNNIKFWCAKNRANNKHFHDGQYWTYNSVKAMEIMFDFLSPAQIRTSLKKLEEHGFIRSGNFNKASYDRTKWYCDLDKLHLSFLANGFVMDSKPIPYINTDNKPDSKHGSDRLNYKNILSIYNDTLTKSSDIHGIPPKRKELVKSFFTEFKMTEESFKNYLEYINDHEECQWMFEKRSKNDGSGKFWQPCKFEYFLSEKCYLNVKENL